LHDKMNFTALIHGCASGADSLAQTWAERHQVPDLPFPADWHNLNHPDARVQRNAFGLYDARAGMRRNERMLTEGKPDLVVAFPGGNGTANMKRLARKAGIRILTLENYHEG
jgi:hypothetical protein